MQCHLCHYRGWEKRRRGPKNLSFKIGGLRKLKPARRLSQMVSKYPVIMGTHGRKGLDHTIFGSVAENVMKKSPVPVLVINPYKMR